MKLNWKKAWLPMLAMILLEFLCIGTIIGCEIVIKNPTEYDAFRVLLEIEDIKIRLIDMSVIFELTLVQFVVFSTIKSIWSILFDIIMKCRIKK